MKERKYKIVIFMSLLLLLLSVFLIQWRIEKRVELESKKESLYAVQKKEKTEPQKKLDKQGIYSIKNEADDNQKALEALQNDKDKIEAMEIKFVGYNSQAEEFSWLQGEDWRTFCNQVKAYLYTKNLKVSKVTIHPNSQQTINEYLRYLYFEIDYATETADKVLVKAICDMYKDNLRFAFELQYGD